MAHAQVHRVGEGRDARALLGHERRHYRMRRASTSASRSSRVCWRRVGAYVRFATRDAALLELMFTGKHKQESGALHEAGERGFSVIRELIEQGQAEGVLDP